MYDRDKVYLYSSNNYIVNSLLIIVQMKLVSLILFIYYIIFFCSLIAEFLLPPSNILPCTYRDLSSIIKRIGMHYEAIHACPDDHVIYYNQHEFPTKCLECHISRYQTYQVTKKVLRYIPIIPRLQWLFRCKKIAKFMDYHARNGSQDDVIRISCRWLCI